MASAIKTLRECHAGHRDSGELNCGGRKRVNANVRYHQLLFRRAKPGTV
jgi:hypothetical protein